MKTIKHTVFNTLATVKSTNEFTRRDIQKAIWIAQGNDIKTFVLRQGYYADAIQGWNHEGLLEWVKRGVYVLTDNGLKFGNGTYEEGVKLIRKINKDRLEARRKAREERNNPPHIKHAKNFQHFVGKTIVNVRYATPIECSELGWNKSPIVFQMSDGTVMYPQCDDEGNDGGALAFIKDGNWDVAYTI